MKQFHGYLVTKDGEIYSKSTGQKLYTWHNAGRCNSYERVKLYVEGKKRNFYVHRVVAQVHKRNFQESLEVHHIDGNTLNNNVKNLAVISHSQNIIEWHKSRVDKVIRGTRCIVKSTNRALSA